MTNIIRANFYRIVKNKNSFICLGICFGLGLVLALLYSLAGAGINDLSVIAICITVTVFLCSDFQNATIRNKLIVGKSRISIYWANLLTVCVIGITLYLAFQLPYLIICNTLAKTFALTFGQSLVRMLIGLVAMMGCCTILTFVCMIVKNTVACMVICFSLLLVFGMATMALSMLIASGVISGAASSVLMWIMKIIPFSQLSIIYQPGITSLWVLPLCAIAFIAVITGLGILLFRKSSFK